MKTQEMLNEGCGYSAKSTAKYSVFMREKASCGFCKKLGPIKRCGKRDPKCLKKLFCNEACEAAVHKNMEDPAAAANVAAQKAADKKKIAKFNNFEHIISYNN